MSTIDLIDAMRALKITEPDQDTLAVLQDFVASAVGAVEDYKGEVVDPRPVTQEFSMNGATAFQLSSTPVISLTSIATLDGATAWDVSKLHASANGGVIVLSGPPISGLISIVYQAGYSIVPPRYKRAALVILQHAWETQRGVGGVRANTGQDDNYDPRFSFSIPRRALEWLGPPLPGVA